MQLGLGLFLSSPGRGGNTAPFVIILSQTGDNILVDGLYDAAADAYQFRRETSPGVYETSPWITAASMAVEPQLVFAGALTVPPGPLVVGSVLTFAPSLYAGSAPMTHGVVWLRNGVEIVGSSGLTYPLVADDIGKHIEPAEDVAYA